MIFFDIDDTLVDYTTSEASAIHYFAQDMNLTGINFTREWKSITQFYYHRYLAGEMSFDQQQIRRMQLFLLKCGRKVSHKEAASLFQNYLLHFEQSWCLFEDVLPMLSTVKAYP